MLMKTIILLLAVTACAAVPSSIVRPCNSIPCIASHLASQSSCNPHVPGSVPDEYVIRSFRFDTPFFNATYIDNDLVIRNHNQCFVSEYYYNVATQKLVIGLDCPLLEFQSTRTVIQHHSLREDVIYDYSYQGMYPLIRLTVTMPLAQPFDLCSAFTYAEVTALPKYRIDPKNKKTANFLSRDESFLMIFERETFFWRARQLARFFINSVICNFGSLIRLTVTMPLAQPFDLCSAFTYAEVTALPKYRIDPKNKKTANFLSRDESFLMIFERETFFWRARQLARFFINSVICNFGCN